MTMVHPRPLAPLAPLHLRLLLRVVVLLLLLLPLLLLKLRRPPPTGIELESSN
jgi:hypothetical protein